LHAIRTYRGGDEAGLIACWNAALSADPLTLAVLMRKVLCDLNFDPVGLQIAEAAGEIIGFALALRRKVPLGDVEPEWAWLSAFGVHPQYRQRGIGRALLRAAETFARGKGRRYLGFAAYAPHYFVPGIDREHYGSGGALLDAEGYRTLYSCVAMDRSLVGYETPNGLTVLQRKREGEGYRFGQMTVADLVETIAFAQTHFGADWSRAIREAVERGVPLAQFRIVRVPAGEIVGFAMFGGYDHSPERFGPFGVAESQRGKGLGKLLLHQAMHDMLAAGVHDCWFLWTDEESPAGYLYKQAGFEVTRRFEVMRKVLD
jgi:GNAT superfamily N-acetyltransferase